MKLSQKIFLSYLIIVLLMIGFLMGYVHIILTDQVKEEKASAYQSYLHQVIVSAELITNEIEQNVFNQYHQMDLPAKLQEDGESVNKTIRIESALVNIPLSSVYIDSILVMDLQGNPYCATKLFDTKETFAWVLKQDLIQSPTLWLQDEDGAIYLKKDIMQTSPLQKVGILIVKLDREKLISALGLDASADGIVALITEQQRPLIVIGNTQAINLNGIMEQAGGRVMPFSESLSMEGNQFFLTMRSGKNREWMAMQLVPSSVMYRLPNSLSRFIWIGGSVIILVSFLLGFLIFNRLSKNVKSLQLSLNYISEGDFETEISVSSKDEIGELAEKCRSMQQELKRITHEMVQRATEKQKAQYEMLELRYRSLQAQISPHFLCNILSTIDALNAMGQTEKVSRLSLETSRYLRENLRNIDSKYTLLGQELCFVRDYAKLYADVYQTKYSLTIDVEDDACDCLVPCMLLQPLVENAIVHGLPMEQPEEALQIHIRGNVSGDKLYINVSNNGKTIPKDIIEMVEKAENDSHFNKKMPGFGLRSVLQRLRLLYGDAQHLTITGNPDEQTMISIQIPARYGDEIPIND